MTELMSSNTYFCVCLTLLAFLAGRTLQRKTNLAVLNPILIGAGIFHNGQLYYAKIDKPYTYKNHGQPPEPVRGKAVHENEKAYEHQSVPNIRITAHGKVEKACKEKQYPYAYYPWGIMKYPVHQLSSSHFS